MARKISDARIERVRSALYALKHAREEQKQWKQQETEASLASLKGVAEVSPENKGVRFNYEDEELAGFIQQNKAQMYWDQEGVTKYLKENGLWSACSVRSFDPVRFEDLVQRGIIPAADAEKFKMEGEPPAAFIRFGKPTQESV